MILLFILGFAFIFAAWVAWTSYELSQDTEDMLGRGKCNQDCNQGRTCDCDKAQQVRDDFDSDYWPFPTNQKP